MKDNKSLLMYFLFQFVFRISLRSRWSRRSSLFLSYLHKLVFELALFLFRLLLIILRDLNLCVMVNKPIWHSVVLLERRILLVWGKAKSPHVLLGLCHLRCVDKRILDGNIRIVNVKVRGILVPGNVWDIPDIHSTSREVLSVLTHFLVISSLKLRLGHA